MQQASKRWWFWDSLFDRFRWYRRRCGGHWEHWYIDVIHGEFWYQLDGCTNQGHIRPPLARGTPTCEDYVE